MGMTNLQVAKAWATQSKPEGRTSNGNMSFAGATLYSYSTPIGHIAKGANGQPVFLITAHTYSVTTQGKHVGPAHKATGYKAFTVPFFGIGRVGRHGPDTLDMAEAHKGNLDYYAAEIAKEEARLASARVYKSRDRVDRLIEEREAYKRAFGL